MSAREPIPTSWMEPPWAAPLSPMAAIEAIPKDATIHGFFLTAVVDAARERVRATLPTARESYVHFRPYPLREHAAILVEAARAIYPRESLRQGLRRLGRGAPSTLVSSMLGRIVLGSAQGPVEIVQAMAKSYPQQARPGTLEVVELAPGQLVVRLRDIHHFLDCHHVGVFEGVLRYAEVDDGRVQMHGWSRSDADLLLTYSPRSG